MHFGASLNRIYEYTALGAFGRPGVERGLGMLRAETRTAMQQLGAPSLKDLTPAMVRRV